MYGLADKLASEAGIELAVATFYRGKLLKKLIVDGITYYLLPVTNPTCYSEKLEPHWKKICSELRPSIIHIHGTEFAHGLACMRACPNEKYIVSMQGFASAVAKYYYAGISLIDIFKNITLRDLLRFDTIYQAKRKFAFRGMLESEYFKRAKHAIGRTDWDYAYSKSLNPEISYHHCNDTLRDVFYGDEKWVPKKTICPTIFLSQATYPIKGLHIVLKAVGLIRGNFPSVKIRIAGTSIVKQENIGDVFRLSGYGKYIKSLVRDLGLSSNIEFTGPLTDTQMVNEYLNATTFICPSSIENSPNSLAEAQILGVPIIASYVGGVPNMVAHNDTGLLYRFEDVEVLAELITKVFNDEDLVLRLSESGIAVAQRRHNPKENLYKLMQIYALVAE